MENEIFTIGHSNYQIEKFIELLTANSINAIADVRSNPYSKYASQFSRENLKISLEQAGITYVFLGRELGARQEDSSLYDEKGKINFEKVAISESFKIGLDRVLDGARKYKISLMCSEKNPLDCHRTHLIARNLCERGARVLHILEDASTVSHEVLIEKDVQQMDLLRSDADTIYQTKGQSIAYQKKLG